MDSELKSNQNKLAKLVKKNLERLVEERSPTRRFESLLAPFRGMPTFINSQKLMKSIKSETRAQAMRSTKTIFNNPEEEEGQFYRGVERLISRYEAEDDDEGRGRQAKKSRLESLRLQEQLFQAKSERLIQELKRGSIRLYNQKLPPKYKLKSDIQSVPKQKISTQSQHLQALPSPTLTSRRHYSKSRYMTEQCPPSKDKKAQFSLKVSHLIQDIECIHEQFTKDTKQVLRKTLNFQKVQNLNSVREKAFNYLYKDAIKGTLTPRPNFF